jgi:hypothetical protein
MDLLTREVLVHLFRSGGLPPAPTARGDLKPLGVAQ